MAIALSALETTMLNKFIPRMQLREDFLLNNELRSLLREHRDELMQSGNMGEKELEAWQVQAIKNIGNFLRDGFLLSRDEHETRFFLSERGKNLKKQGTIEKYQEWLTATRAKNKYELHTIETRGYLDQDPIVKNKPRFSMVQKLVLYPAIIVLTLFIVAALANKYKMLDKYPAVKHLFQKDKDNDKDNDKDK